MENLKIRVNSEDESKMVQEFLFKLGYKWFSGGDTVQHQEQSCSSEFGYLVAWSSGCFKDVVQCGCGNEDAKEITLPELRDLVILKRNDVGDATHIRGDGKKYFHAKSTDFFYQFSSDGDWLLSTWMNYQLLPQLQPIEKPMKEYLRKNSNGTYSYIGMVQPEHVSDFMIEIPEGATKLVSHEHVHLPIMFVKPCANGYNYCYPSGIWSDTILSDIKGRDVFWSRYTHPEELPFIDDEPKITTAKGSELDYIAKIHDMRDRYNGESDEDYRYQLEHYISRKEPSLNDQYAEIEKVRQSHRTASGTSNPTIKETLNQRQSQYGSFEDVATATQDLLKILERVGLKSLPSMHKEALHMICSKMVRIVNGDHNFIESWHDIAGYATLMENELRVTDGATNSRLTYQKVINGKLQDTQP